MVPGIFYCLHLRFECLNLFKSPIKKSSVGESPREAYPTDSVTSSYGVGPTDENGRPLFGLKALRRTNTGPNNQIPQDCADLSPSSVEPPREKLKPRPTELKDASGRPLFGGLRALKRQPVEDTEEPQGEEDMPEQPVSPQLKDLVSKHEQRARGNTVSQPSPDRQKPRAKLRDSFLLKQDGVSNAESPRKPTSEDSKKLLSHRTTSLKAIIQKHESIAKEGPGQAGFIRLRKAGIGLLGGFTLSDISNWVWLLCWACQELSLLSFYIQSLEPEESETDKQQRNSENLLHSERTSEVSPVDLTRRTGILKKSLDDDDTDYQVTTESSSRSTATVVSSRGTMRPDGTISLTRDVLKDIKKEQSADNITIVFVVLVCVVVLLALLYMLFPSLLVVLVLVLVLAALSFRGGSGKAQQESCSTGESVQRNDEKPVNTISRTRYTYNTPEGKAIEAAPYDDDDSRTSSERRGPRTQAASSTRRSQTTQDTTTTSVGRDNKSRTATRTTSSADEEHKFSSSTSTTSRTSRVTPDKVTTKISPARVSTEKSFLDSSEDEHTTSRGGRYESSTVTSLRSTEGIGSPLSVRRRIFANDEEIQDKNISKSVSNYKVATSSSTSSSVRTSRETSGRQASSSSFLEEERKSSTGRQHYDDDYESDSYQKSGRVVSTNNVPESSRLSSERSTSGDTRKVYTAETRYSTSSTTERRSSGTTTTDHVSRSSPPSDSSRRRSSNLLENREGSPTPSNSSTSATRLARGGSVRALSQKFLQQAAEGSSESSRPQRNYPKAGLIFRSTSFRQSNGDTNDETHVSTPNIETASSTLKQSMEGGVDFTSPSTTTTPRAECEGKSFLSNQTRVTGVQDVLTRMRNADQDVETGDSLEDREARALLNKFLGAQVLLSGVESVLKPATHTQSAALVRQVERQRILKKSVQFQEQLLSTICFVEVLSADGYLP
uniref:Uncharacterized protein n=1 Tax=Timema genevievae TaxID=629358 RepID=A0A7R9PHJ8_TIMGE|nr:unnamed protein product [Timema genevievae]